MSSARLLLCCLVLHAAAASAEEPPADPRRPAAVRTEGVPHVPPEVFQRLNQYQNVRGAAFLAWAHDGSGLLIRTRFGNSAQLHRVYEPGGRREQITFFEEPVSGAFIPKAQDGAITLILDRGGDENDQLYLLDRQQYQQTLLTDGKSRNLLGPYRHDGGQMIVHSNQRNGRDTDIYVADSRRPGTMELILPANGQFWSASDWSRDGTTLGLLRYVSANESYPALFDVAGRTLAPLPTATQEVASYSGPAFAPDGQTLYLASDAPGEFRTLARFDRATEAYSWLSLDINWDVEELEVDPATGRVAFAVNEDGASRLYLQEGDTRRELVTPLGIVSGLEFSPDGARLGFTLAKANAPPDVYSLDVSEETSESGGLTQWTFSEAGGLDPRSFIEPVRISYPSFDERQIPAYYYRPAGATAEKPAAVLIGIHGGPEGQYQPYFSGITQYYLNELGLAVIYPNVRGSAGYGKTYLKLDNVQLREDSVRDIGALLDWIAQQPELDASRVAVSGGSYGGYMVLASLVHFGDRLKAGIDNVGIANFITFLEQTSPYRQDLRRAEYGDERDPATRAFFERINPTSNVENIRSALLVAHGVNDPRVPYGEAQQIAERVCAAGRSVWTVYAENEGHGFAKKDNRDYLTAVEAMFLKEHLGLVLR